jgi:hypothetical protein
VRPALQQAREPERQQGIPVPDPEARGDAAARWQAVTSSAHLRAAVDRVIPADDWPGGWEGGVGTYLAEATEDQRWAL